MTTAETNLVAARAGERLDRLARRLYGSERGGSTEALLAANAGLAEVATAIPEGRLVRTPEAQDDAPAPLRPWE